MTTDNKPNDFNWTLSDSGYSVATTAGTAGYIEFPSQDWGWGVTPDNSRWIYPYQPYPYYPYEQHYYPRGYWGDWIIPRELKVKKFIIGEGTLEIELTEKDLLGIDEIIIDGVKYKKEAKEVVIDGQKYKKID